MNAYFRSRRRKLGVVTLVLACTLAAGWVRSLTVKDSIATSAHHDASHDRGFLAAGWINSHQGEIERVTSVAVGRGGKPMPGTGYRLWSIRYSIIVVPLTLLSAWLLLSKPPG